MINPEIVKALLKKRDPKVAETYIHRGPEEYTLHMIKDLLHTIVTLDNEKQALIEYCDRFGVWEKLEEEVNQCQ